MMCGDAAKPVAVSDFERLPHLHEELERFFQA
jgi:hypothetical protein